MSWKEKGVKITQWDKMRVVAMSPGLASATRQVGIIEGHQLMQRYAILKQRSSDESKVIIELVNPVCTTDKDPFDITFDRLLDSINGENKVKYLLVDKECLDPVDDKELFLARLKGK